MPQSEEVDWNFPVNVRDVVMMGRYGYMNLLRIPGSLDKQVVRESLERVEMWPMRDRQIGELSGGQKKRTFFARALAQQATVLLLDEPSLGLAPQVVDRIFTLISDLRAKGLTILLVEQNVALALEIADRGYVLVNGRIEITGTAADLIASPEIRDAYLGA